ncbi:MAG: hypothetical protein WD342_12480 [Verrucomicrobiales bacterium]
MEDFTKEAARLQLALAREDADGVDEQLFAMVKKWLALHNAYYSSGPGNAAASEEWQEQMISINRLVAEAFKDARQGNLAVVGEKTGELGAMLRRLDASIGAPDWHVAMLDLRHTLELSLAPDTSTAAWLEARLREASAYWETLPESDRPEDDAGRPLDIAHRISTLLATPKDRRPEATETTLAFLDERLAAFRARVGGVESTSLQP